MTRRPARPRLTATEQPALLARKICALTALRQSLAQRPVTFQVPFTAHRLAARRVPLGIQQDPDPPAR